MTGCCHHCLTRSCGDRCRASRHCASCWSYLGSCCDRGLGVGSGRYPCSQRVRKDREQLSGSVEDSSLSFDKAVKALAGREVQSEAARRPANPRMGSPLCLDRL